MSKNNDKMKEQIRSEDYKTFKDYMSNITEYEQIIDPDKFALPDMGDFMQDEMSIAYARQINEHLTGDEDLTKEEVVKNIFYLEKPFSTDLGYHEEESVIVLRPSKSGLKISDDDFYYNKFDGDTIYMNINDDKQGKGIDAGRLPLEIGYNHYENPKEYILKSKGWNEVKGLDPKNNILGIRFLGIDAPELPKFGLKEKNSITKTKKVKNSEIHNLGGNHTYEINKDRKENGETEFVQLFGDNHWFEVKRKYNAKEGRNYLNEAAYDLVLSDNSEKDKEYAKQAENAKRIVQEMMRKADDILIILDTNTLSQKGNTPPEYSKSWFRDPDDPGFSQATQIIQKAWDDITNYRANMHSGFNSFGMDTYRRFLGAIYLRMPKSGDDYGGEWINLAKYVASQNNKVELLPDFTSDPYQNSQYGFVSNVFKMWTYSHDQKIVDALIDISDIDDREKMQEKIFGRNYRSMMDWTVTIGDCTFLIPPTSIKLLIASQNERLPLLRSRGGATKSNKKDSRTLQLDLFFNEERGINGYPVNVDLPGYHTINGKTDKIKQTYYMNGLRSLVSMFMFTPFLPIENDYINNTLNIDAVSLVNMHVSSVPSMPKTVKASLILQEFDYRVYMPELPMPEQVGLSMNANMFAHTINHEVMRYYYQKPIMRGEEIQNIPINSDEYIVQTLGDRTALQPMNFVDPYIHFYRLDENYLKKKMQAYLEREKRGIRHLHKVTKEQLDYRKNTLAPFMVNIEHGINELNQELQDTNSQLYKLLQLGYITSDQMKDVLNNHVIGNYVEKVSIRRENVKYKDGVKYMALPTIYLRMPSTNIRPSEHTKTLQNYCEELEIPKDSFKNHQLVVNLNPLNNEKNSMKDKQFIVNPNENSRKLMTYVLHQKRRNDYETMSEKQQGTLHEMNKHNDIENEVSLRYEKINIPPTIVTRYNVLMSNTFNNLSLQMSNGYAPQYLGGQDVKFEVEIETIDKEVVSMISALPREIAMTVREYREILTVYPIRVDTEFTRFFGCNEVVIESVEIDTESSPEGVLKDHWLIRLTLVSVDRTLRNRERLKDIEQRKDTGGTSGENAPIQRHKTFWNLKDTLAQAEIYPDLELPSITELERMGFKFIRYSESTTNRVYPDPDFYFYYGHVLMNEMLREGVARFLGEQAQEDDFEYEVKDSSGANAILKYDYRDPRSYYISKANQQFKDEMEKADKMDNVISKSKADKAKKIKNKRIVKENEYLNDLMDAIWRAVNGDAWNISDDIIVRFRELALTKPSSEQDKKDKNSFYYKIEKRSNDLIKTIDSILDNKPSFEIPSYNYETIQNKRIIDIAQHEKIENSTYVLAGIYWDKFIKTTAGAKIMEYLNLDIREKSKTGKFLQDESFNLQNSVGAFVAAIASARTAPYEFDGSIDLSKKVKFRDLFDNMRNKDWKGEVPTYCLVNVNKPGMSGVKRAITAGEVMKYGFLYGSLGIEEFDSEYIENITGEKPSKKRSRYFIDPYYRNKASEKEIQDLRLAMVCNERIAIQMAGREMLYWLKKMLEYKHILTSFDLMQEGILKELEKVNSYVDMFILGDEKTTIDEYVYGVEHELDYRSDEQDTKTLQYLQKMTSPDSSNFIEAASKVLTKPIKGMYKFSKNIGSKAIDTVTYYGRGLQAMLTKDEEKKEELLAKNEQAKHEKEEKKKLKEEKDRIRKELKQIEETLKEDVIRLQLGKVFFIGLVTASYYDEGIMELVQERNYEALNSIILTIANNRSGSEDYDENTMKIIKYVRALAGYKLIENPERIGSKPKTTSQLMTSNAMSRIYIAAAENPMIYLKHSFYDMIVNDKRGRMARAFPTFYMLFIDEGREIGWWKLHDNFYNMSSISSFQVVKSRKIAADTAVIQMNNMFQTFDRYDDDLKDDDEYTFTDYFTSIFSPRTYYIKEEIKRLQQEPVHKFLMKPGIRMHLRMGYGSNASTLPIVFNGVITDVQQGDLIELVAQGDGVELTNPITFDYDAEDIKHQDKIPGWKFLNTFFTRGATPKTILTSLMHTEGGPFRKAVKHLSRKRLFNESPLGIVHFGDKEFTDIFPEGEMAQNIYEATSKPAWEQGNKSKLSQMYSLKDAPKLSMHIFEKTFWDVMHVCASASPDFIAAVAPFNFRSTIFHGRPRYYYAYDYEKRSDGNIIEKRKPFQQYHIYTSYSDIIENRIIATEKGLSTCAVGLYDRYGPLKKEKQQKLNPMWADVNVYPEKQKTMTVDTQLLFKGIPIVGDLLPFATAIQTRWADDKGVLQGGHSVAWRMTANALKSSMKDMYRGELLIIGDPSVKPHDKIHITDLYEKMTGTAEVEAVVHSFDVQTGFVTQVYPDLVSVIDDPLETATQGLLNNLITKTIGSYLTIAITAQIFVGKTKPLANIMATMLKSNSHDLSGFVGSVNSILGDGNQITNKEFLNAISQMEGKLGFSSMASAFDTFKLYGVDKTSEALEIASKLTSETDPALVGKMTNEIMKTLNNMNPDHLINETNKLVDAGMLENSEDILKSLNSYKKEYAKSMAKLFDNQAFKTEVHGVSMELNKMLSAIAETSKNEEDIKRALDLKRKVGTHVKLKDMKDIKAVEDAIKFLSESGENDLVAVVKDNFNNAKKLAFDSKDLSSFANNFKNVEGLDEALNGLEANKYAMVSTSVIPSVVVRIIAIILTFIAKGTLSSMLARILKSYQVLQIFPLMKNGRVLTAGMEGSKGVIVGSPRYNDKGAIDGFIAKLYDYNEWDGIGKVIPGIVNYFSSKEMQKAAQKSISRENLELSDALLNNNTTTQLLEQLAVSEVRKNDAYYAAIVANRVNNYQDHNGRLNEYGKAWFHKAAVMRTDNIEKNVHIKDSTIAIEQYDLLNEYLDDGMLTLAHNTLSGSKPRSFTIGGQDIVLNCIEENNRIDIPVLREDALLLLNEIMIRVKDKLNPNSIKYEENIKKHPVIIQSCLVAGAKNLSSTGMSFTLTATNMQDFEKILVDIISEQKSFFEAMGKGENKFFEYKKKNNDRTTFLIEVMPTFGAEDLDDNYNRSNNYTTYELGPGKEE